MHESISWVACLFFNIRPMYRSSLKAIILVGVGKYEGIAKCIDHGAFSSDGRTKGESAPPGC